MTTLTQERTDSARPDDFQEGVVPSRQSIEDRMEHILNMPESDIAQRLIGLVALSHDTQEIPPILVGAIEDTAEQVIDELNDADYAVGEVVALVDAAHLTGKAKLAEKALEIVQSDTDFERFGFDTHAAVELSSEQYLEFGEAKHRVRKMRDAKDIPMSVKDVKALGEPSIDGSPLAPGEYDWVFDPNPVRKPRFND